MKELVKNAVEIGEVNLIWKEITDNDKVMKEIERRISEVSHSRRMEEEQKRKLKRLEFQALKKSEWEMERITKEIAGLAIMEVKKMMNDDWLEDVDELLDDWLNDAYCNVKLVDDDITMVEPNVQNETTDAMEIDEGGGDDDDDWMMEEKVFEDWLED